MCSTLYFPLSTVIAPVLFFNPDRSTMELYILSTATAFVLFFYPDRSILGLYIPLSTATAPVLFLNTEIYPGSVHSSKYCYGTCSFLFALRDSTWGCTFLSVQRKQLFFSSTLIDPYLGQYISLSRVMPPVLFLNPDKSTLGLHIPLSTAMAPVLFFYPGDPTWDCTFH